MLAVPLDGAPDSEAALPVATALARGLKGTVVLVGVVDQIRRQGIAVDRGLRVGMPTAEIADAHAALSVMTTHGQNDVPDTAIGSVALALLHLGNEPVLFVRPD